MKQMFLLFSHKLTQEQVEDAKIALGVEKFVNLSEELQRVWSNIPTDIPRLEEFLKDIKKFLVDGARKDDFVLIQGDFGAVYEMVNFSKSLGLISVYATTKRETEEIKGNDNKIIKKSIFKHRRFREYGV